MPDLVPLRRALLSVHDKSGLVPLARALAARGVDLLSTGGTAAALRDAGLAPRDVAEVTGWPEMMGGRVKTLHPRIHGGLLARRDDPDHAAAMAAQGIPAIDLAVVNLYPFAATVASGADPAACVEQIDIGGPAMIRAAAKNHRFTGVLVDPADYDALLAELDAQGGATRFALRCRLAATAYAQTAAYDSAVAAWMADQAGEAAPRHRTIAGSLRQTLRYGENPHQRAAFYTTGDPRPGVASARQVQGKPLSWNNINDCDAAFEAVSDLAACAAAHDVSATAGPAVDGQAAAPALCVIVKHANPCGVARAATTAEAFARARDCDRTSAFGGIVALSRALDVATARAIAALFAEVVIAPGAEDAALHVLGGRPNLRVLLTDGLADPAATDGAMRQVAGGFLWQDRDAGRLDPAALRIVTRRAPGNAELADMLFAWAVARHVKSNAIVYARDGATVGIGAGQMSRVDSTRIAARKAAEMGAALGLDTTPTVGAAVASDAFFPFADGLVAAAEAGATAVIQPGGSVRDAEVIAAADDAGLAMAFTGMRHFRH